MTDSASSHPARTPRRRPRLHHIYFLLAAFDLFTVSVSLFVIDHLVDRLDNTVEVNREWATRMDELAHLRSLAIQVNTPGNTLFNPEITTDDGEDRPSTQVERSIEERITAAATAFDDSLTAFKEFEAIARERLLAMPSLESVISKRAVEEQFKAVRNAMSELGVEAQNIFDVYESNREEAGMSMASMDMAYGRVSDRLTLIGSTILSAQNAAYVRQSESAQFLRRLELLLGLLILMMVGAVTVYGHRLSRQVRRSGEELEELVATRTADLESTHDRLRMADRLASIGTLAAGLGHDINNILFPLRCHLESLRESELSPEAARDVESIHRSTEYLQQLTNAIRMFARDPDAPSIVGSTRIDEWWTTVHTLMARSVGTETHLHDRIQDGLPPVAVPPHQLTQAVLNLLVNAAEAVDTRGNVTVWAERDADDDMVRLGVTDDGVGMTAEVRQQALDPFFTTKSRGKSTGLGLSMVHGVVSAAGGVVEIESKPDHGTTIVLRLPVADEIEPKSSSTGSAAPSRVAMVAVQDPRLSAFVTALVQAHGFETMRFDDDNNHADENTSLWVLDHDADRIDAVRARTQGGELIVLTHNATPPDAGANGDSLTYVETHDLGKLRTRLSTLLHDITGRLA